MIIYNIITSILVLFFSPYVLVKICYKKTRAEWLQRLGIYPVQGTTSDNTNCYTVWVHAASVGEVQLAGLLITNLHKTAQHNNPIKFVLTVMTRTGYEVALSKKLPVARVLYLPIDVWFCTRHALNTIKPNLMILIETELWPNLITCATNLRSVKIAVVNGRISKKSFRLYSMITPLTKKVVNKIRLFLVREQTDTDRFTALGASTDKIVLTGNMKYDLIQKPAEYSMDDVSSLKTSFGFSQSDKIFVAGSIREGEETTIIDAYLKIKQQYPLTKMIFVPRHLTRIPVIKQLLTRSNIRFTLKSRTTPGQDVCLVDTFGDLVKAYKIGDAIFVGGSLLPRLTGQNMIEPVLLGKPVMFGPYTESFNEPARILKQSGIGTEISSGDGLATQTIHMFLAPGPGKDFKHKCDATISSLKGATDKNLIQLQKIL
jgi:3-deoxy-D-manno-octulosonic-acid transferase